MSSKKRKKKKQKARARRTSGLREHTRTGKRVIPPLLTVPQVSFNSWLNDILPDFLWMCALLTEDPLAGMRVIASALDLIDEALVETGSDVASYGRLTQFEAIPPESRGRALELLQDAGIYEIAFPEGFAHGLGMYANAPGKWLIEPRRGRGFRVDPEQAQSYLSSVVQESYHGQHLVPTRAKFMYHRGLAKSGRLHFAIDTDIPDLFSRYPEGLTEEERRKTEPTIRASFGALISAGEGVDAREDWGKQFWRANWNLYLCKRPDDSFSGLGEAADLDSALAHFTNAIPELVERFEEVALRVDPDLYAPDRYEVLTGIAARTIRLAKGAASAPVLWTNEFGMGLLRSVVEARILIRWLKHRDDATTYQQFKEYGRGRLKLLKLHTEEYIDSLEEVPESLSSHLASLEAQVNADTWEEYQEIDLGPTFSGVSARDMAIEVELKQDYDFVFAPASSAAHGDWTALDRYALERCRNPLHLWHRIPSSDSGALVDPGLMGVVLEMAEEVVDDYVGAFEADRA